MAGQIAPHLGNGLPEGSRGHQSGSLTNLCCHHDEKVRIEDLAGGTLRLSTRKISQLGASGRPMATASPTSGSNERRSAPDALRDGIRF